MLLDLNLRIQNLISDVAPVFTLIRKLVKHAFVANHTQAVKIHSDGVLLATHHLRGHVTRSTACLIFVVVLQESRDPEVTYPEIPFVVEHQVGWFDVSVEDVLGVDVGESLDDAGCEEF